MKPHNALTEEELRRSKMGLEEFAEELLRNTY